MLDPECLLDEHLRTAYQERSRLQVPYSVLLHALAFLHNLSVPVYEHITAIAAVLPEDSARKLPTTDWLLHRINFLREMMAVVAAGESQPQKVERRFAEDFLLRKDVRYVATPLAALCLSLHDAQARAAKAVGLSVLPPLAGVKAVAALSEFALEPYFEASSAAAPKLTLWTVTEAIPESGACTGVADFLAPLGFGRYRNDAAPTPSVTLVNPHLDATETDCVMSSLATHTAGVLNIARRPLKTFAAGLRSDCSAPTRRPMKATVNADPLALLLVKADDHCHRFLDCLTPLGRRWMAPYPLA